MPENAIDGLKLSEEQREVLQQGAWNIYEMAFMASIYHALPRELDLPRQTYLERQRQLNGEPLSRFNDDVGAISHKIAIGDCVSAKEWQRFAQVVSDATRGCVHWNGNTFYTTDAFRLVCMDFCRKNPEAFDDALKQEWIADAQIETMKQSPRASIGTFLLDCVPQLAMAAIFAAKRPATTRHSPDTGARPA